MLDDLITRGTDANTKLAQLKSSSGGGCQKVYTSVEEFMADRQMLIDVVFERRHKLQVTEHKLLCHDVIA